MEHDVRAAPDGPADRLRIAPTLMADHDTKCEGAGLENPPPGAGRIDSLFRGVQLDLVLETGDCSIWIDDQCSGQKAFIGDAFRAENYRKVRLCGGRCNGRPGAFEERQGREAAPASPFLGNRERSIPQSREGLRAR